MSLLEKTFSQLTPERKMEWVGEVIKSGDYKKFNEVLSQKNKGYNYADAMFIIGFIGLFLTLEKDKEKNEKLTQTIQDILDENTEQ